MLQKRMIRCKCDVNVDMSVLVKVEIVKFYGKHKCNTVKFSLVKPFIR